MELWLPYGKTEIPIRVPDDNFYRIIEPKKSMAMIDTVSLIEKGIDNPIGGLALTDVVKPGCKAGIIVDPAVPSEARIEAIKVVTSRLSRLGVETTRVFIRNRLSGADTSQIDGTLLDPSQNSFTEVGKTSLGTTVELDPELLSCETKITIGLVMPHYATGFTGGPEAILPSASSIRSITKNRSLLLKGLPEPLNIADNPVLNDSLEASKLAGPVFSICFQPDGWNGVDSVLTGELEAVFRRATSQFAETHSPKLERKLDIVVVSAGNLLGADLYHAVRVLSNVIGAVRKGGTVILVAECSRGIGNSVFLEYARRFREPRELSTELRHRFRLGGHINLYLQKILEICRVQLVSVLPEVFARDTFDLKPSQTASEAVQKAIRVEGKESKILIIPRGDVTVPLMGSPQTGA
jgi:lactate racemase